MKILCKQIVVVICSIIIVTYTADCRERVSNLFAGSHQSVCTLFSLILYPFFPSHFCYDERVTRRMGDYLFVDSACYIYYYYYLVVRAFVKHSVSPASTCRLENFYRLRFELYYSFGADIMVGVLSKLVSYCCLTSTICTSSLFSFESAVDVRSTSVAGADTSMFSLFYLLLLCLLRVIYTVFTWNRFVLIDSLTALPVNLIGDTDAVLFLPEYCLSKFNLF